MHPLNSRLSLHTRISLVLTSLAASLLIVLAGIWLHGARSGIHEEVEAANRVSVQWLSVFAAEMRHVSPEALNDRVLGLLRPLGRVRANDLEVIAANGAVLYASPQPTYKAGRSVPDWFSSALTPKFEPRSIEVGSLRLVIRPDASRSLIDAWDDLCWMAAWATTLLAILFMATRHALDRALRPLGQVMLALDSTGAGRFETRLPVFATPELARISRAFNGMADRLVAAVNDNVRLETEREVDAHLQGRLEAERSAIARELHDELAQGITAVRALAGAIIQRSGEQSALLVPAQGIVAVTGEMQEGVRGILHRLHPPTREGVAADLARQLAKWQCQHPEIALDSRIDFGHGPVNEQAGHVLTRMVQEGLTNVVRHARATRVELLISRHAGAICVSLADNGIGPASPSHNAGSGLGLRGMAERLALLGGELDMISRPGEGFRLVARFPDLCAKRSFEELR